MRLVLALTLAATSAALATAADPSPAELLDQLAGLQKQRADLDTKIGTLKDQIRAALADLQKKAADLGVGPPPPPPPAPDPKPVDVLKAKLRAAFEADGKPTDAAHQLAELYTLAAKLAKKPEIVSTNDLKTRVNQAAADLMKDYSPDTLKNVRAAVLDAWTAAVRKADDTPIADAERTAAADLFTKLAEILGGF